MRGNSKTAASILIGAAAAFVSLVSGCHAGFQLRGTVVTHDRGAYAFDASANPSGRTGIEDVHVALYVTAARAQCPASSETLTDSEGSHRPEVQGRSDKAGRFELGEVTLLGMVGADNWITLCFEHPKYDPYGFSLLWDGSSPGKFAQYLNVSLRPKE